MFRKEFQVRASLFDSLSVSIPESCHGVASFSRGATPFVFRNGVGMSQSENAPAARGPKQGHVTQDLFAPKDDFDKLDWGECDKGKQYAPTTRTTKSGVEVPVTASRPCQECTSTGCPWRPEYRVRVRGQ